ncbi:UDP-4-amino-4-deoxy-L-arabinose--oxoglutarate aminotransferase [uncultured spirochete]|uniref:UDP-4-amino-4-deoxy-L-arabinose--oxoglutarate aminotransferase n=1 Tax=uncultured spirochete TaxID=156406 RepID=A0A3P3XQY7_9SPIR|nr:UDP-4-amino-4-deoxy-L-arabinose--oxoglutarate aminotransferase [uncultured spirochete]
MITQRTIAFSPPDISDEEIQEVVEALRSGWITTGPKTKLLEQGLASFCHVPKAVCLNSATAAMEMTLRLLGVGPGDEVITSAYTYSASASVIDHVGARIVLVDSGMDSFHIDYEAIADAITERTKAIIPVDIGGVMADYDRLFDIVESRQQLFRPSNELQEVFGRVIVLADAAHSVGAVYKGKMSGEVADFTSFSFHAVKNLTTAEGGAIAWRERDGLDSEALYRRLMLLSLHGQSKDALAKTKLGAWEYDIVGPWFKCNMTDILAALGLAQLRRYQGILQRRREIIERYDALFEDAPVASLRHYTGESSSSGHLYLVRLLGKDEAFRNRVITRMAEKGIATNVHYKPLPMHTAYKNLGFDIRDFPHAFEMYRNEITLPLHTLLSDEDVEYVAVSLKETLRELAH